MKLETKKQIRKYLKKEIKRIRTTISALASQKIQIAMPAETPADVSKEKELQQQIDFNKNYINAIELMRLELKPVRKPYQTKKS